MVQTRNVAKRQKTEECTSCIESVLYNSDSLFKIASYLPAVGLFNLALTCRRFGIGGDDSLSLIEETARRIVHDVATEEQKNALSGYDEDNNWLCKYDYLQLLRAPLTFDQVAETIEYVVNRQGPHLRATAFSNNIMMAGKHYASFETDHGSWLLIGVMRPGQAMESAKHYPTLPEFYNHFTQRRESRQYNNSVNCCMYYSHVTGIAIHTIGKEIITERHGMEWRKFLPLVKLECYLIWMGGHCQYKNGRKLGVMKRGLAGQYCWVVSLRGGTQVTIKRGTVPAS